MAALPARILPSVPDRGSRTNGGGRASKGLNPPRRFVTIDQLVWRALRHAPEPPRGLLGAARLRQQLGPEPSAGGEREERRGDGQLEPELRRGGLEPRERVTEPSLRP